MNLCQREPNRLQGFVLGLVGGTVGTVAIGQYWSAVTTLAGKDPRMLTNEDEPGALDSISLVGKQYEDSESSTMAMGRIAYQRIAGEPPQADETKSLLSYLIHYGYGSIQGGAYGAITGDRGARNVTDGAAFGTSMWHFGDELAVGALGLTAGPTKFPLEQHLHRWGAHLVYGLVVAATTKALRRFFRHAKV